MKIRGLNLPGTPWALAACCGRDLTYTTENPFYYFLSQQLNGDHLHEFNFFVIHKFGKYKTAN
jgi:hypothetical protein